MRRSRFVGIWAAATILGVLPFLVTGSPADAAGTIIAAPAVVGVATPVGASASQTVTVTYVPSASPFPPAVMVIGNPTSSSYAKSDDTCSGAILGVGGSCSFTVTFTPTALGTAPGVISVTGSPVGATTVVLASSGTTSLMATPPMVDLGQQAQSDIETVTFTVTNTSASTINLFGGSLAGTSDAVVRFLTTPTPNCPIGNLNSSEVDSLAPGATCVVNIRYRFTSAGAFDHTVSYSVNGQVFALRATASVLPLDLELSTTNPGASPPTVENQVAFTSDYDVSMSAGLGETATRVLGATPRGPLFVNVDGVVPAGLASGPVAVEDANACNFRNLTCSFARVFLRPTTLAQVGTSSHTLEMSLNAMPLRLHITTVVRSLLTLDGSSADAANVTLEAAPGATVTRTVVVTNTAAIPIGPLVMSGPSNAPLTYTGCAGSTLAPGATCAIVVSYSPTSAGTAATEIVLHDKRIVVSANTPGTPTTTSSPTTSTTISATTSTVANPSTPALYAPVNPVRVLDTRFPGQIGYSGPRPSAGQTVALPLAGIAGIGPGTKAVALNVTVTETDADGFVTVYPCDSARPNASNLNHGANHTVPNLVLAKLSATATVCLFTQSGGHLVADLQGVLPGTSPYVPVTPVRLLDTRSPNPVGFSGAKPGAGQTVTLAIGGLHGVPPGASAAVLNLTATDTSGAGFATAFPCDQQRPNASNLNHGGGATVPNLVIAKLSSAGTVCIFTQSGAHLVADLQGYLPAGSTYTSLSPVRVLETRASGQIGYSGPKPVPGQTLVLDLTSQPGVSAGTTAVAVNVTATEPGGAGFVTVFPCDQNRPNASNLNHGGAQTVANLVLAKLSPAKTVCLFTQAGTHLVADLQGSFG